MNEGVFMKKLTNLLTSTMNTLVLIVGFIFVLVGTHVQADINSIFAVTVKSSLGHTFKDCYRFDTPSSGDLSIDELGQTLTYVHGKMDGLAGTGQRRFKAVTRGDDSEVSFFGKLMNPGNRIHGEAVGENGASFVFTGKRKGSCTIPESRKGSETSPYTR